MKGRKGGAREGDREGKCKNIGVGGSGLKAERHLETTWHTENIKEYVRTSGLYSSFYCLETSQSNGLPVESYTRAR